MKKVLMVAASGLLLCSTSAMAQTTTSITNSNAPSAATSSASATGNHQTAESVRAQIRSDMEKAGFTDVKVMPDSFLVEAKDKSGDPVSMIVNPNAVTEVVNLAVATPAPSNPAHTSTQKPAQ